MESKEIQPKEKAQQLVDAMLDKLYDNGSLSFKRILHARAIECAKVLANEMLHQYIGLNSDLINWLYKSEKVIFWQSVIAELDHIEF